jgi:hypothetical protein
LNGSGIPEPKVKELSCELLVKTYDFPGYKVLIFDFSKNRGSLSSRLGPVSVRPDSGK